MENLKVMSNLGLEFVQAKFNNISIELTNGVIINDTITQSGYCKHVSNDGLRHRAPIIMQTTFLEPEFGSRYSEVVYTFIFYPTINDGIKQMRFKFNLPEGVHDLSYQDNQDSSAIKLFHADVKKFLLSITDVEYGSGEY